MTNMKINTSVFYFKSTCTLNPQVVELYSDKKFTCMEAIFLPPDNNTYQVWIVRLRITSVISLVLDTELSTEIKKW